MAVLLRRSPHNWLSLEDIACDADLGLGPSWFQGMEAHVLALVAQRPDVFQLRWEEQSGALIEGVELARGEAPEQRRHGSA